MPSVFQLCKLFKVKIEQSRKSAIIDKKTQKMIEIIDMFRLFAMDDISLQYRKFVYR